MNRYARIDPAATGPQHILGIIETDLALTWPGLLDIRDRPEVTESAWYCAVSSRWVASPPSTNHEWNGNDWELNAELEASQRARELADAYQVSTAAINTKCEATITGGFWSDALGERHQYSSQLDDQLNLTGVILAGLDSLYACRDEQGLKAFRPHTFAQLRQVGDDFTLFKLQLLQHANDLKQQLDQALAAGDLEAIERVTWENVQP
jgi:hypothetical protein